ncbi:LPXTG cell wall anchor domain-containing protein, partial [Candidatus Saccharibacteria bacterium]|nr:LPXTG cell wall anchor domain-containing protein [Candidatus Saccharibacteria bacterium]
DDSTVRKIVLLYNDKYTDNLADTDIIPYQEGGEDEEKEPPVPETGVTKSMNTLATIALPTVTMATISVLAGVLIYRKRRS